MTEAKASDFPGAEEMQKYLEVEKLAKQIDWTLASKANRPPQDWFEDTDNPFEPEEPDNPIIVAPN